MASLLKQKKTKQLFARHKWLRCIEWNIEALLLRILWLFTTNTSPERASRIGSTALTIIGPRSHKHRHVLRNLSIAFPTKSESDIEALAKKAWANFGAVLAEFPHLETLLHNKEKPYIDVVVDEEVKNIVRSKRPSIMVVPHLANWELIAGVIVGIGAPLSAIFSPQQNPILDKMIQRKREKLDCRFLAKQSALRAMFRELGKGRFIGLLPDQRVDSGKLVPFFGEAAPTTISPARVAMRYNCDIIPVRMERLESCHFRATFYAPVKRGPAGKDEAAEALRITTAINEIFAAWITERPDQWLCMKRRWPKQLSKDL